MKTSVHFNAAMASADRHNRREKELKYVRAELTPNNQYSERFTTSVNEAKEDAQQRYRANHLTTKTTHRKMKDGSIKDYQKKVHKEMPKNATPSKRLSLFFRQKSRCCSWSSWPIDGRINMGYRLSRYPFTRMKGISIEKQGSGSQTDMLTWLQILPMKRGTDTEPSELWRQGCYICRNADWCCWGATHGERTSRKCSRAVGSHELQGSQKLEEIRQLEEENKELTAANKAAKANAVAHLSNFVNKLVGKDPVKARDAEIAKLKEELNKKIPKLGS